MYSEAERDIFKYNDGEGEVYGDPLALLRGIMIATNGDPDDLTEKVFGANSPDEGQGEVNSDEPPMTKLLEAKQAEQKLVGIVRKVFEMKPYRREDNMGAQDSHCLIAWRSLARYLSQKKRNAERLLKESVSTDGLPDSPTPTASTSG